MRIIAAAAFYFLIVFGVSFLLGPVRVFWLEPRLGETIATLSEAPFLLIAIVLAARWLPRTLGLKANVASLAEMGIVALLFQQLADFAVGIVLRGSTPCQQFARHAGWLDLRGFAYRVRCNAGFDKLASTARGTADAHRTSRS